METLYKIAAIFFDIIFVLLVSYFTFVFGLRLYWKFKSKRMRGQELPILEGEFLRLKRGKGVIYFHAPNCRPCKFIDPVIKKLSKELKKVAFIKVNIAEKPELARKFGILATPSIIITKDGHIEEVLMGPVTEGTLREKLK
ncbi:Thioredoxin domain-containing protein [Desulfurobacterium thermolithotrophum DSM 11699]|uniref:Thioredoxin domain-containing protein n=1 Tax=Desulfurobacterium thermolithotrophum (strain DSM 11699 / BSA) TaxID=868864 RepID=F0S2J5_DESTD|nr:thioredoxin family protein [Desulfurobacterium thermolithotrophum]ADY73067.1 Thioredoxin domain-containing protein [Desulfurobacterium thermolithotrophum DSM 11699]